MPMAKERLTTHHLLCQHPETDTNLRWSNHPTNLIRLREWYHSALHTVLSNKMIANQMLTCVDISKQALLPEVVDWLVETLTQTIDPLDPTLRYKEECIIK